MKAAAVYEPLAAVARQTLIHTGQHYDSSMSDIFFQQLGLPAPDVNLGVGSASHAVQTAEVMLRIEPQLLDRQPDLLLVYGDVNSTLAAALVCSKLSIPVAHVEAGLRSGDRTMPEEINRIVTDALADILFTPSSDADDNLKREGVSDAKIRFVGNVMIDTLIRLLPYAESAEFPSGFTPPTRFVLVTLHRPSNVDCPDRLRELVRVLDDIALDLPVIFPIHPRTRARLRDAAVEPQRVTLIDSLGYVQFLALQRRAKAVITDSGGIQEETTFLGVPCFTLRLNTERPITVTEGTNMLIGDDLTRLRPELEKVLTAKRAVRPSPRFWDGGAGKRIAAEIAAL